MNTGHAPILQTFEDKPNGVCRHVGTAEAVRSLDTHTTGHTHHWTQDTQITGHTDHWTHTSLDTHCLLQTLWERSRQIRCDGTDFQN